MIWPDYNSYGWHNALSGRKVIVVKSATHATLVLFLPILVYSQSGKKPATEWFYPNDANAICSQESERPYSAAGLPEGTVAVETTYCKPGFLVHRPHGNGFWKIESVEKLYYRGKLFAIVGTGTCFSEDRHEMGCIQAFVIYDAAGNGRLGVLEDPNDAKHVFHVPDWVTR